MKEFEQQSPSRARFSLAAKTGIKNIEALWGNPVDCCLSAAQGRLAGTVLLTLLFAPLTCRHSLAARQAHCQMLRLAGSSVSCQLFLLTLYAAFFFCQPASCIPFISHLFASALAVLSSPATILCSHSRVPILFESIQ